MGRRRRGFVHLGRYGEILAVLIKYGFDDVLANLNLDPYRSIARRLLPGRRDRSVARRLSRWERIRLALEELGPTFIKLGQFLSSRADILPADLIEQLEKLQDSVAPIAVAEARAIVSRELKAPLESVFEEFMDVPVASASIAQVHKARLVGGEVVALKIQRPRIASRIRTDLDILFHLTALFERRYEQARALHLTQLAREFEQLILKELDFLSEAAHIKRFVLNFKDDKEIYLPRLYDQLTTPCILATEFIVGVKVTEVDTLVRWGLDPGVVARRGARLVVRQIFEHGFFHADPHPGNILVLADGRICFLDFGAVGIVPPTMRTHLGAILYGIVNRDAARIVRTLAVLSHKPLERAEQLEYDVAEFIERYSALGLGDINLGQLLQHFTTIIVEHQLKVIPGFYLLLKTLVTIEAVGVRLDKKFSLIDEVRPWVQRLLGEGPNFRTLPYDILFTLSDVARFVKDLPYDLKDIMELFKSGQVRIKYEHHGLEPLLVRIDAMVTKLVFALVLAALIVGSSLVVLSDIPPKIYEIPVIGLVGFVLAGLIGFGLLFSIIRRRKV
jgi:ubiquinone biosynthesis protein